MIRIMFVCLGNICRSPALMAAVNYLAVRSQLDLEADSSGIGWVRLGQRPHPSTFETAKKRGVLIDHISQQFQDLFFETYDLILPVEQEIAEQLRLRGPLHQQKIKLATDFSKKYQGQSIPDPYYLGPSGFDHVMDIAMDCSEGIIDFFKKS